VQQTVVGAVGVTAPVSVAVPDGAHWPPAGLTDAVTLRAVAARFWLHAPTAVVVNDAGAAQSVVAETETLSTLHVAPVAAPHEQDPAAHARVSVAPAKYTCCAG
jgi:hypothetical protein